MDLLTSSLLSGTNETMSLSLMCCGEKCELKYNEAKVGESGISKSQQRTKSASSKSRARTHSRHPARLRIVTDQESREMARRGPGARDGSPRSRAGTGICYRRTRRPSCKNIIFCPYNYCMGLSNGHTRPYMMIWSHRLLLHIIQIYNVPYKTSSLTIALRVPHHLFCTTWF